jgi:hypothetical protein
MTQLNNPIEILKLLDKSNCSKCNEPTCLAFAAALSRGQKMLGECPNPDEDIIRQFGEGSQDRKPSDWDTEEILNRLKDRLNGVDLAAAAKRIDAAYKDGNLTLKVCGKDFGVDTKGNFSSEIHIHSWLTLPVLNYILEGEGVDPSGEWVRRKTGRKTLRLRHLVGSLSST